MLTKKFHIVLNAIMFIAGLFTVIADRPVYGDLISFSDMISTTAWNQTVEVDYTKRVYYNAALAAPTVKIIEQFTDKMKAKSSKASGWDQDIRHEQTTLEADVTSSGSANGSVTITLPANEKDHFIDTQMFEFEFTPTDAAYTNYGIVVDKQKTTDLTTIIVKPADHTKKFGIASGEVIAAGTRIFYLGTRTPRGAEPKEGVNTFPSPVSNEFQDLSWPWSIDDISKNESLYIAGTPENILEKQKTAEFQRIREKTFLWNPPSSYKRSINTGTDSLEDSHMAGIYWSVRNGGSPANTSYDTWGLGKLDEFTGKLNDSSLEDVAKVRLNLCNSAFINKLTVEKRDKPGIDLSDNGDYGIPGIKNVKWGSMTLHCMIHYDFDKRWPSPNQPACLALTMPFIEYRYIMESHLRMNIQNKKARKAEHEFRSVETWLGHQLDTAYFGAMFPNTVEIPN